MNRSSLLLACLALVARAVSVAAQSSAPKYRWTFADTGVVGGTLAVKISYAPTSVVLKSGKVTVWMLTEQYRASDDYREKYYGEFSIDCRTGYARETSSVMDRFGCGKPPRYGQKQSGFNDYPDVLNANSGSECAFSKFCHRFSLNSGAG